MKCPKCSNEKHVKNGFMRGKQRYKCKVCGCNFTQETLSRTPLQDKIYAIKLYLEGVGFRAIERLTQTPHTTVIYWVKTLGEQIERMKPEVNAQVMTVELDEMWHFIQKKRTSAGHGLDGIEKENAVVVLT
jgi:transposase-like protein